jgi:DNA-binding winged helix-turn-helix (wHTH) protein/TolB-like protein
MIRFSGFDLDPASLRICRDGTALDAAPQTVEVLVFLIENRERTVGRSELLDRFWPRSGTGGDAALNTCIRRIRSLLGDDADTPRFIQTRPRSGYRFIGAIHADAPEVRPTKPAIGVRRPIAVGAVLTALVIGGAVWAQGMMFPARHRIAIEPVKGLCEYVLFPHFNAGLRESFIAEASRRLPANYSVAANGQKADLHARVSVRQTQQRTTVVVTLAEEGSDRVLWSGQFAAPTDMQDYVPLQGNLARSMATDLARAVSEAS